MSMSVGGDDTGVMSDINVTPLVDVMLVLLIIFMIVTPAIMAGFQAQLPEGAHLKARPEKDDRTTMGIDAMGAYYLNKKPVAGCMASQRKTAAGRAGCMQAMSMLLVQEFTKHPQDKVLFVKADRNLKYQEMLDAMALGRDAGAKVLAAVTDGKPGAKEEQLEQVKDETG
jgi:biopolymer transport protein TolR